MKLCLSVGALVLLTGYAAIGYAAEPGDIRNLQLFAPADLSTYGYNGGPKQRRNGFWFAFDGLNWSIQKPDLALIGRALPANESELRKVFYGPFDADDDRFINPAGLNDWRYQTTSHDTSMLQAAFTDGNRLELGRMDHDSCGWFISTYQLRNQTQFFATSDMDVFFRSDDFPDGRNLLDGYFAHPLFDPITGEPLEDADGNQLVAPVLRELPVTFDEAFIVNRVKTWSVEMMGVCRLPQTHWGGNFELFGGVRYMEFNEEFNVDARGTKFDTETVTTTDFVVIFDPETGLPIAVVEIPVETIIPGFQKRALGDSTWNTRAENNIVGPQIGIRWWRKWWRFTCTAEGRFFAGFNQQTVRQVGVLGTDLDPNPTTIFDPARPAYMERSGFTHRFNAHEFSPAVELRLETVFQVTDAVSLKAGWTGFWVDSLARPSGMIDYNIPPTGEVMGINGSKNRQDVFTHGGTIGFVINR